MRFKNYINENYKKALNIGEPETGGKYSDDSVQRRIKEIEAGIKDANKLPDDEHKEGIIADLEDKLDKWSNVDQETEAPKSAAPPEGEEGEEGEEEAGGEEEADAEAEEEEAAKDDEDKEKEREDKDIEKDDKAVERDEKREKEREKKEKEREKKREKGQKKEGMNFKQYMYLNSTIKENAVENTFIIIKKGRKIATDTENPGHYYVDYNGETFWIKGNRALNQGDTKEFIKKVKAGKIRFVKLI